MYSPYGCGSVNPRKIHQMSKTAYLSSIVSERSANEGEPHEAAEAAGWTGWLVFVPVIQSHGSLLQTPYPVPAKLRFW